MINKKAKILIIVFSITLIIIFVLSQTILFTWSPVKLGYNCFEYEKYNVYTEKPVLDEIYESLDSMLVQCEDEHNVRLKKKIHILICDDKKIHLYIPWLKTSTAAAVWPNTIYISTGVIETFRKPVFGIKHEVSHILLLQNYGELSCAFIWKTHEWLPEGYAVYITQGYPKFRSKSEVLNLLKENVANYTINTQGLLFGEILQSIPMTVRYSLYYFYIKYLIEKYGKEKLLIFIDKAFRRPEMFLDSFTLIFKRSFYDTVIDFNKYLYEEE
jgi:hypothetical protein